MKTPFWTSSYKSFILVGEIMGKYRMFYGNMRNVMALLLALKTRTLISPDSQPDHLVLKEILPGAVESRDRAPGAVYCEFNGQIAI